VIVIVIVIVIVLGLGLVAVFVSVAMLLVIMRLELSVVTGHEVILAVERSRRTLPLVPYGIDYAIGLPVWIPAPSPLLVSAAGRVSVRPTIQR
jgi:hypothetical protein